MSNPKIINIIWNKSQNGYNPGRFFTIFTEDGNSYRYDTQNESCIALSGEGENTIKDPICKYDRYKWSSLFNLTKDGNFSWITIHSKEALALAAKAKKAEATLAYEAKLAELAQLGFIFTLESPENNRKYFSTHELFEFKGEIYLEESARFFEICLADSENPCKTELLYKTFNLEEKLQQAPWAKTFNHIKNISKSKVAWTYKQNLQKRASLSLDNQIKLRTQRLAKAQKAIEDFLTTGIINGNRLGSDSWHDCSYKAEEQAEAISLILGFKITTELGYQKELNEFDRSYYKTKTQNKIKGSDILESDNLENNILYWQVYDDGISNHPYSNYARLTISEEVRLNLSENQLGWLFNEGWIE